MKHMLTFICLSFLVMSCSISESIVFNEQMGGVYKSTFDMSQILAITKEGNVKNDDETPSKVIDTTLVFNQFLEQYKDSISSLPKDEQKHLYAMKDVLIDLHMNEDQGIFNFTMHKPFADFEELKQVNQQLDAALGIVQNITDSDAAATPAPQEQITEMTKTDPVTYTFSDNVFTRSQPKKEASSELGVNESAMEEEDTVDLFKGQFEDMFKVTLYTMTYTFPKPIKSVSNKDAVISEDRKTITFQTDVNAIDKNPELMNLEVTLQD